MRFGYTIIYVQDVRKTIDFNIKAFGMVEKFVTPECDYGELATGETTLAFASFDLAESNFSSGFVPVSKVEGNLGVEIVLVSENIETDFKTALDNCAELLEPIKQKPWGQKVGYLKDINGLLIEVCTPMDNTN